MQLIETKSNMPLVAHDSKILSGLFAEMGTFNQNGRRYPEDIYEAAYEELMPKIRERRLCGELDHPQDYDEVRLSNVSHVITDCGITEDNGIKKIYGTVELLDTPAGMIAQALVKAGINLGISSRGVGATKQVRDGVDVTQLKLITYDLVADPSFANAVLTPAKSKELSDSLDYIEKGLPLNESIESDTIRSTITRIRESLITRETPSQDETNIEQVELDSLKNLLESTNSTIKSDTELLAKNRQEIKSLRKQLAESKKQYKYVIKNMLNLQEAYNGLKESAVSPENVEELQETIVGLRKQLAVEKRGMSYTQVSELLEGATTEEEIESKLNSISSLSKKRQTKVVSSKTLTEGVTTEPTKMSKLASIISQV